MKTFTNILKFILFVAPGVCFAADIDYDMTDQVHLIVDPAQSKVILNLTAGGENILFFRCGEGTFINGSGQCEVADINTPISLVYGVNDVSSCTGLNGTPEWQGTLPVGSGTGEFEIDLPSGITQTTSFTISCNTNRPVRIDTKVAGWNYTEFELDGSYTGIFKWIGDTIYAVKYTDKPITVKTNNTVIRDEFIPYLVVSETKPVRISNSEGEFTPMESKACGSRGGDGLDLSLIHISEPTRPY